MKKPQLKTELTREEWLKKGQEKLNEILKKQTGEESSDVFLSIGSPLNGDKKGQTIGVCYYGEDGKKDQIFITPRLGIGTDNSHLEDSTRVLDILLHELIHTMTKGHGHKGKFARFAKACNLTGPMTATKAGQGLRMELENIVNDIGLFPSESLSPMAQTGDRKKKQSTRMLKAVCPDCEYTVRLSNRWASEALPCCPLCSEDENNNKIADIRLTLE